MKAVGLNLGAAARGQSPLVGYTEGGGWHERREARPDALRSGLHRRGTECNAKRSGGFVNADAGRPTVGIGYQSFDPLIEVSLAVRVRIPLVSEVLFRMGRIRNPIVAVAPFDVGPEVARCVLEGLV